MIKLFALAGAGIVFASGVAAFYKGRADTQKAVAEQRLTVIEQLKVSNGALSGAHETESNARGSASQAARDLGAIQAVRANAAEKTLRKARQENAQLDFCLSTDFGVDLSGGVLVYADGDDPAN